MRNILSTNPADFISDVTDSSLVSKALASVNTADLPTNAFDLKPYDLVFATKLGAQNASLGVIFGLTTQNFKETLPIFEFRKNKSVTMEIPINAAENTPSTFNTVKVGDPVYVKYVVGVTGTATDLIFVAEDPVATNATYKSQVLYFARPADHYFRIGYFAGIGVNLGVTHAKVDIDPELKEITVARSLEDVSKSKK
jgi:hypothetical protein